MSKTHIQKHSLLVVVLGLLLAFGIALMPKAALATSDFEVDGSVITGYVGDGGDIVIPSEIDGVTIDTIGDSAFNSISEITSVVIPENITEIEDFAFAYMEDLQKLEFKGSTPPVFGNTVFSADVQVTIVVPQGASDNYIDAIGEAANEDYSWFELKEAEKGGAEVPEDPVEPEPEVSDFVVDDNGILVKYTGNDSEVLVPESVNGVTIVGIGGEKKGDFGFTGVFAEKQFITKVVLPSTVTTIGKEAFYSCRNLEEVNLPEGLVSIGERAFDRCNSLAEVTIPASTTDIAHDAFVMCEKMENIFVDDANTAYADIDGVLFNKDKTLLIRYPSGKSAESYAIPEGTLETGDSSFKLAHNQTSALKEVSYPLSLKKIGPRSFTQNKLTKIIIPAGVEIDQNAFEMNSEVQTIEIQDGVTEIGSYVLYGLDNFKGTLIVPGSVKTIGHRAFDRLGATEVVLNEGLETIGEEAFEYAKFKSIKIPASVTAIEPRAFYGAKLETVSFAKDSELKTLGKYAFNQCQELTSIELPAGITKLDDGALSVCTKLSSITLPESLTTLGDVVFSGSALKSVDMEKTQITEIGTGTFASCTALEKVVLPANLANWGSCTFEDCVSLVAAIFPESVTITSIPYDTFYNCRALPQLYLPVSVTQTEACAFAGCAHDTFTVHIPHYKEDFKHHLFDCFPVDPGEAFELREDGYYYILPDKYEKGENYLKGQSALDSVDSSEDTLDGVATADAGWVNATPESSTLLCGCFISGQSTKLLANAIPTFIYKKKSVEPEPKPVEPEETTPTDEGKAPTDEGKTPASGNEGSGSEGSKPSGNAGAGSDGTLDSHSDVNNQTTTGSYAAATQSRKSLPRTSDAASTYALAIGAGSVVALAAGALLRRKTIS